MYAEMPDTVITAFYAGLMENNAVMNEAEAGKLLKQYFKDSHDESATFPGMFDLIKECMQDDGFFKLTGLDKMLENQAATMVAKTQPAVPSKSGKTRANSKAKSTSAK